MVPLIILLLIIALFGGLGFAIHVLWIVLIVAVVLWLLGFGVFHVAGGLIHLLLVIAVIVILYRLITGRRPVA